MAKSDAVMSSRSMDELRSALSRGARARYLYFWGHRNTGSGQRSPGSACLSQWFPSPFEVDGVRYDTAEQYMMCSKALLFSDDAAADRIRAAGSPGAAKVIGREVRGFDEAIWNAHRWDIVVGGNVHKFSQDRSLRSYLLGTGHRVLVEASPVDRIWGVGMDKAEAAGAGPYGWPGQNLLGFALMEVRARLRERPAEQDVEAFT